MSFLVVGPHRTRCPRTATFPGLQRHSRRRSPLASPQKLHRGSADRPRLAQPPPGHATRGVSMAAPARSPPVHSTCCPSQAWQTPVGISPHIDIWRFVHIEWWWQKRRPTIEETRSCATSMTATAATPAPARDAAAAPSAEVPSRGPAHSPVIETSRPESSYSGRVPTGASSWQFLQSAGSGAQEVRADPLRRMERGPRRRPRTPAPARP